MDMRWWLEMTRDLGLFALESAEVMARRSIRLARADNRARAEFQLMVGEKVRAAVELQRGFSRGKLGATRARAARGVLNAVRRKVRANRRRLRK